MYLLFDLTTNQQLLREKILVDSVVHGFEARKNKTNCFIFICRNTCLNLSEGQINNEKDDSSYMIVVFGQRTFSIIQWSSNIVSQFHKEICVNLKFFFSSSASLNNNHIPQTQLSFLDYKCFDCSSRSFISSNRYRFRRFLVCNLIYYSLVFNSSIWYSIKSNISL